MRAVVYLFILMSSMCKGEEVCQCYAGEQYLKRLNIFL